MPETLIDLIPESVFRLNELVRLRLHFYDLLCWEDILHLNFFLSLIMSHIHEDSKNLTL